MIRKSFRGKIILPVVIVLIAIGIVLAIFLLIKFTAFSDSLITEKLAANINSLKLYLDENKANSYAASVVMADNPAVIKAIKRRDKDELLRIFTPIIDLYRINVYAICDNEGKVLVRVHDPSFGDSIAYQQNVKDAIGGKISSYFERGTIGKVSVRTGAPVYDKNGALIGILSSGVRFDLNSKVAELKKLLNSEVSVLLGDIRINTTVLRNGWSIAGTRFDTKKVKQIVINNSQEYAGNFDIAGEKYKGFYHPLLNAQNEAFAAIVLELPLAELKREADIFIRNGMVIGLIGLFAIIALLFLIVSSIIKPLISLASYMDNFADGNLDTNINIESDDEIGQLAKSLQKAVNTINKLIKDIKTMIAEQNSGNTNYYLDTRGFNGDYEQLAKNISELAGLGMRDQLTRIPNRRSFDNRLAWEWHRAKREKKPVSILILDLDKFKNYNDTFGHQQGDMALVTIATVLMQSLKRTSDFVARWGGEEFVILLPNTHARGARSVAEKIRKNIEAAVIPCTDKRAEKITVSIGVNTQIPDQASLVDSFISEADIMLYSAKEAGRNKAYQHES